MSDFARSFMAKCGWTEGKGLGANEDGLSDPIKVKIKNDLKGVGYDHSKQFTNFWWETAYTKAAANISIVDDCDGIKIMAKENSTLSSSKKSLHITYKNFIQNGVLADGVMKGVDESRSSEDDDDDAGLCDDDLLKACGGRTAHKGARHGIKQSGKLARLEQNEKMFLHKLKCSNFKHGSLNKSLNSKTKKKKKCATNSKKNSRNCDVLQKTKKLNKKSHKSKKS